MTKTNKDKFMYVFEMLEEVKEKHTFYVTFNKLL